MAKKVAPLDIYLVVLKASFGDDEEISYTVEKDAFDWISSQIDTPPDVLVDIAMAAPYIMEDLESDSGKPPTRQKVIKHFTVTKNSSSYDNDKAMQFNYIFGSINQKPDAPNSARKLDAWIKKNNFNVVEEYEGYIY